MSQLENWWAIVRKLVPQKLTEGHFFSGTGDYSGDPSIDRRDIDKVSEAHLITSRVKGPNNPFGGFSQTGKHLIVLDIDHPAVLVPSSTPGRFHLLIDHELPQAQYFDLLHALSIAGVIEEGYRQAASNRSHTSIRTPWFLKDEAPEARNAGGKAYRHWAQDEEAQQPAPKFEPKPVVREPSSYSDGLF